MNTIQRAILLATALVVVLMCAFPPFEFSGFSSVKDANLGYAFVLSPPSMREASYSEDDFMRNKLRGQVNSSRLLAQIVAVVAAGGLACLAFKGADCSWLDEQMPWGER